MKAAIILAEKILQDLKKHFKKIGEKTILEIIIEKLKDINYVNEIIIATGSKK